MFSCSNETWKSNHWPIDRDWLQPHTEGATVGNSWSVAAHKSRNYRWWDNQLPQLIWLRFPICFFVCSPFIHSQRELLRGSRIWNGEGDTIASSLLFFFFCIFSGLVSADYTSFSPCRIRSTAKSPRCVACGGGSCQWWPPGALKTFTRQQKKTQLIPT